MMSFMLPMETDDDDSTVKHELFGTSAVSKAGVLNYGISARQGYRPYMEDVPVGCDIEYTANGSSKNAQFFALLDGHGGDKAAKHAAEHFPGVLTDQLNSNGDGDIDKVLVDTFTEIDGGFLKVAEAEGLQDGCTATSCLVHENKLYCANAGDSRTVLVTRSGAEALSEDHKPNSDSERERIEAAGGKVIFFGVWRVNGVLATSRGFGDQSLKPVVTAVPEVTQKAIADDDVGLILASDGIWDVMSNEEAAQIVRAHSDPAAAAAKLTDEAINKGSFDNVGAVVVFFKERTEADVVPTESAPTEGEGAAGADSSGSGQDDSAGGGDGSGGDSMDEDDAKGQEPGDGPASDGDKDEATAESPNDSIKLSKLDCFRPELGSLGSLPDTALLKILASLDLRALGRYDLDSLCLPCVLVH